MKVFSPRYLSTEEPFMCFHSLSKGPMKKSYLTFFVHLIALLGCKMFYSRIKHLRTMYLLSSKINPEVLSVKAPARPGTFGDLWVMPNTAFLLFSREKCSLGPST